jgi:hypothetical protein
VSDSALREAVKRAESGLVILFRQGDRAIFAFGFAKSAQANISKDLALLKDAAAEALGWNGEELDRLVASGTLVEIRDEHEE